MQTSEYVAARFDPAEAWSLRTTGNGGASKLAGRKLTIDFTKGASSVGIGPREFCLLGTPHQIGIRVRGKAPGHPVRLRLATHFMTFERTIGQFSADGENELVTAAPPGEGWKWSGGENDGKLHGPLRITGVFLDKGDLADAAELELLDIRVTAGFAPQQACVLVAELREAPAGSDFVATLRGIADAQMNASLTWTIRDWEGRTLFQSKQDLTIPGGAFPVEARVSMPPGQHPFLEAEAALDAPGQATPAAQAYYVAPIQPSDDARLDPESPFGMGLYLNRYSGDPEGLRTMDRAAGMAQEAGVKWSREDFSWARIEPRKGQFDWTFYDNLVATAKRRGISIYGLLGYWAAWTKPYTPEGIEDYCRFATAVVEHYRGDVHYWEVWNEPNIFFWQGPRDMYAELLKRAYPAIKQSDPNAKVLGCSTAGIDHKFIKRTMELGAPFDILTIHPYRGNLDDVAFIADLKKVADLVKRPDGAPRQVWITEMGWATHVPHNTMRQDFQPNSQRRQAELLARSYIDALASGAAPNISWYDFRNDGTDPLNFEHNMGIVTRDFRIKPAYRAFATVTRLLKGRHVDKALDLGQDVIAYRFVDADGRRPVLAMWSIKAEQTVQLPPGGSAVLTDLMGTARPLSGAQPNLTLSLQPQRPVCVTMDE